MNGNDCNRQSNDDPNEWRMIWTRTDADGDHCLILQRRDSESGSYKDVKTVSSIDYWDWGKALRQSNREIDGLVEAGLMPTKKIDQGDWSYDDPQPKGWAVQYRTFAETYTGRGSDLEEASDLTGDPDLPAYACRYISPDRRKTVLVIMEGAKDLFGPYVDEDSMVGYGLSYKDVYQILRSNGVEVEQTSKAIEDVIYRLPQEYMYDRGAEIDEKVSRYQHDLLVDALVGGLHKAGMIKNPS